MNQELIQQIKKAVRKALEAQSPISVSTPDKKLLAIFDAAQIDLASPLQQLEKCIQDGYAVSVILSDLAAKVLDVNEIRSVCGTEGVFISGEITDLRPFVEDFPLIVLPIFSHSMGAKLALGLTDTPCTYLVFQAMLRGDRILNEAVRCDVAPKCGGSFLPVISMTSTGIVHSADRFSFPSSRFRLYARRATTISRCAI